MTNPVLHKYLNGNVSVTILSDGTKIRQYEGKPEIVHPESIDIKITNYCDLTCKYCHEMSHARGRTAIYPRLKEVLSELPAGVELALGGGNPLSHPNLDELLTFIKDKGMIANLTVNQQHLPEFFYILVELINTKKIQGLGISITDATDLYYVKLLSELTRNVVFHVIAGVNKPEDIDLLLEMPHCKLLVLGYKVFGRGKAFYSDAVKNCLEDWDKKLPTYIGKCHLSFDNLAIEQLHVRSWFTDKGWAQFYMGDDFTYTMYYDAVEENFAPTSRSNNRQSSKNMSLLEYFKTRNGGEFTVVSTSNQEIGHVRS